MSYESDILIDESALDVEWLDQPRRMVEYTRLAAEARRGLDFAQENVEFVKATLDRAIRADPARYGVVAGSRGVTEDSIKAGIQVHEEYQIAAREAIDRRYEHEVAVGAVRAFDQRKTALENLVRLHGQSYFAGPAVPRDLPAERQRRDRETQARVRIGGARGDDHAVPRRRSDPPTGVLSKTLDEYDRGPIPDRFVQPRRRSRPPVESAWPLRKRD